MHAPDDLVIARANGSVIPSKMFTGIVVQPDGVSVTLAKGAFRNAADAAHATVATKAYYYFGAGAPVRIGIK